VVGQVVGSGCVMAVLGDQVSCIRITPQNRKPGLQEAKVHASLRGRQHSKLTTLRSGAIGGVHRPAREQMVCGALIKGIMCIYLTAYRAR